MPNGPLPDELTAPTDVGTGGMVLHPNPFVSNIDITLTHVESSFEGQVILLDNLGREVIKREFYFEAGYNSFNIDGLESLTEGLYVILIKKDGEIYASGKMVKLE
jgi:hypothetical protein